MASSSTRAKAGSVGDGTTNADTGMGMGMGAGVGTDAGTGIGPYGLTCAPGTAPMIDAYSPGFISAIVHPFFVLFVLVVLVLIVLPRIH